MSCPFSSLRRLEQYGPTSLSQMQCPPSHFTFSVGKASILLFFYDQTAPDRSGRCVLCLLFAPKPEYFSLTMPSSGSKRRAVRDLQEALDPDSPNQVKKAIVLEFVKERGDRSFWDFGNRLRQDMVFWMAMHRSIVVSWMPEIEAVRPGYFNPLPGLQMEPFLDEYQLLLRNNIFSVNNLVPSQTHSPGPESDVAGVLSKMAQVIENTSSAQARLIKELKAQLGLPACPARPSEEDPNKTTGPIADKQSLKKRRKSSQFLSQDPHSVKVPVVAGSSHSTVSQRQPTGTRFTGLTSSIVVEIPSKRVKPSVRSSPPAPQPRVNQSPPCTDYGGSFVTSSMFDDVFQKTGITANTSTPHTSRRVQDAPASGSLSSRQPRGGHPVKLPAGHRHRHAAVNQPPAKTRRLRSSMAMVTEEEPLPGHPPPPTPPHRIRQTIEKDDSDSSDSGDDSSSYVAETEVEVEFDEDCSGGSPPSDRSESLFVE
ncbi:hypothetical protein V8F06_010953 [Rhypophila decipiens]